MWAAQKLHRPANQKDKLKEITIIKSAKILAHYFS